jgi:hypothetical protein
VEQLQDLLSVTHVFKDLNNLVVNKENLWLPYNYQDDNYVEIQYGDWLLTACEPVHDPAFFTIGIIIYTDKTGKGAVNSNGMELLVFAPRKLASAWIGPPTTP